VGQSAEIKDGQGEGRIPVRPQAVKTKRGMCVSARSPEAVAGGYTSFDGAIAGKETKGIATDILNRE
jgi:hypothetical protein